MLAMLKNHYESIFLIAGNAISRILMIISTIIMVRFLGDHIYSKYAVLYNGLLSLQVFITFGLNAVATKNVAQGESSYFVLKKIFYIILFISILFFSLFYLLINFNVISDLNYFKDVNFGVLVFSIISLSFFSVVISVLYGNFEKVKVAIINIINSILILFFLSVSSSLKDLNLIFFSFGLANFISILLCVFLNADFFFKKTDSINTKNTPTKYYIKQGYPIFLSALLVTPVVGVIYTLMHGSGLGESIGVFSVAMQWYSIILFVPGVLANLLLAEFSKKKDIISLNFYFNQIFVNFLLTLVISFIVYLVLIFILPIYGEIYEKNIVVFYVLMFSAIINSFNTVAGQFFISLNRQVYGLFFNFVWASVVLVMTKLLLDFGYGLKGVAFSFFMSYLLHAILQNIYIYYFLKSLKNE